MYQEQKKWRLTLRDILGNPSSLSYFMEFMDRRRRSLLVQFWLTVESFKNPLESIDSGTSDEEDEGIQDFSTSPTIKEDISMINDLYFSRAVHPALAAISQKHVDLIRAFAESQGTPSGTEQRKVRRSVMLAQRQVEQVMEQDFEDFERSELWFRAIGDREFGSHGASSHADSAITEQASRSHQIRPAVKDNDTVSRPTSDTGYSRGMKRSTSSNSQGSIASLATSPPLRPHVTNIEVLMSPAPDSSSGSSRPPLFDDSEDRQQREEERRMEAIQAALTDIMALEQEQADTYRRKEEIGRSSGLSIFPPERGKRRAVFDDDLDDVAEDVAEADENDHPDALEGPRPFELAGPGDLQLSYEISRLAEKITNLEAQDIILNTLIKKAELTGDTQELKLLGRSKSSMTRDLRELKFQKLQYEQQESANRLFSDRTNVSILNSTVGDEDGKSVVRYLIEIQQLAPDGTHTSGWVVARRYNEFFNLHNKLRERYALVRGLDFPGKRLVASLSGSFLDTRRVGLEKYLKVKSIFYIQAFFLHHYRILLLSLSYVKATNFGPSFPETHPSWLPIHEQAPKPRPSPGPISSAMSIALLQKALTICSLGHPCWTS